MESTQYRLDKLPTFPRTLLDFKHYDGWKTLMIIGLVVTGTYFFLGLVGYGLDHNAWVRELILGTKNPTEVVKHPWWKAAAFWTKPIGSVTKEVLSAIDILFRGLIFLCSYCLTWAAFDRKNIEGYIMGVFNVIVGMTYILTPTDVIPDILPVIGSVDDTIFSSGMILLGAYCWHRNASRENKTQTILDMVGTKDQMTQGNLERALQLLLEDRGVHIEFLKREGLMKTLPVGVPNPDSDRKLTIESQ